MQNQRYINLVRFAPSSILKIPDIDINEKLIEAWINGQSNCNFNKPIPFEQRSDIHLAIDKISDMLLKNDVLLFKLVKNNSVALDYIFEKYHHKLSEELMEAIIQLSPSLIKYLIPTSAKIINKNMLEIVIDYRPLFIEEHKLFKKCRTVFKENPELYERIFRNDENMLKYFPKNILTEAFVLQALEKAVCTNLYEQIDFVSHLKTQAEAIEYLKKRQIILTEL